MLKKDAERAIDSEWTFQPNVKSKYRSVDHKPKNIISELPSGLNGKRIDKNEFFC